MKSALFWTHLSIAHCKIRSQACMIHTNNRSIWSRVIAKKWFLIWRPSAILNLGICDFFTRLRRLGQNLRQRTKFRQIRTTSEIWRYNGFKNGGRPPCWIYCDVIILCRKTEFNALDIVLNFDVHRFHNFWYTSIMFHHFSLKLPIFAIIFTYFLTKRGKY